MGFGAKIDVEMAGCRYGNNTADSARVGPPNPGK